MSRKTIVLVHDLDGSVAAQGVRFSLDGQHHEVDLSEANATRLRDAVAPYVGAGRRTTQAGGHPSWVGRRPAPGAYDPKAVRAWAASGKIAPPVRGTHDRRVRRARMYRCRSECDESQLPRAEAALAWSTFETADAAYVRSGCGGVGGPISTRLGTRSPRRSGGELW